MAAMGQPETIVGDLCRELGITRSTLYRHVSPTGESAAARLSEKAQENFVQIGAEMVRKNF